MEGLALSAAASRSAAILSTLPCWEQATVRRSDVLCGHRDHLQQPRLSLTCCAVWAVSVLQLTRCPAPVAGGGHSGASWPPYPYAGV